MTYAGRAYGGVCRVLSLCRAPHRTGKGVEHGGAPGNPTGARGPVERTENRTKSGISGRTAGETQEKQAHLADRGSNSAHHCGDCGGRVAVNSGSGTEVSNLANMDALLKMVSSTHCRVRLQSDLLS